MSKVEVNQISSQCGSTLTIGQSTDTVTLAEGVGGIGTVSWDTTAKTTAFTAASGRGYFVNTTSGAITVTLPASPSAGDIVAIKDYAQTFNTNNCTLARNGSNIEGSATDIVLDGAAESVTFVYVDSTKGWVLVGESLTKYGPSFITATGGTITCCGDYKIHTFTGPGTFTVTSAGNPLGSNTVDYLVVAGGGSGGGSVGTVNASGGGGAGGFRISSGTASGCYTVSPLGTCVAALPVTASSYPITVGAGGAGGCGAPGPAGNNGSNSVFSTITSTGGGRGGRYGAPTGESGQPGGSGGGGGFSQCAPAVTSGGTGNTPPVSPSQGNDGGTGGTDTVNGGGGGAGAVGGNGGPSGAGNGGVGSYTNINPIGCVGTPGPVPAVRYFAGGGGGASECLPAFGTGGAGGGGCGGRNISPTLEATSGTVNTGGGGGGAQNNPGTPRVYGSGGSGIVIIRYKYQ